MAMRQFKSFSEPIALKGMKVKKSKIKLPKTGSMAKFKIKGLVPLHSLLRSK